MLALIAFREGYLEFWFTFGPPVKPNSNVDDAALPFPIGQGEGTRCDKSRRLDGEALGEQWQQRKSTTPL